MLRAPDLAEEPVPAPGRTAFSLPWRRAAATAASVWACAALAYLLVNSLAWTTRGASAPPMSGLLEVWNRWDTQHYVTIASTGYDSSTENPAFFPLYPMVMRILDPVLPGGMLAAGLIISSICCLAALALLYRLTEDLLDDVIARRTVFYLMAFPFGFFVMAPYNESMFLAFSLAALYAMRRSQWLAAGLLGALASATRQAGVLLMIAFAVEYLRQRQWKWSALRLDALAAGLIPLGVGAFALYCWAAFGDPLKFVHVQAAWGREPTLPWVGTGRALGRAIEAAGRGSPLQPDVMLNLVDIAGVLFAVVLLLWSSVGLWRLGTESAYLLAFAWADLLLVLASPLGVGLPLHGAPRYVLELIPAFMVLGRLGASPRIERLYLLPAIAVQGVLLLLWFEGAWLS